MRVLDLSGYPVTAAPLPVPPVPAGQAVHDRLVSFLAAFRADARPEDVAGYLADGFPDWVAEGLERPHERDELDAFVNMVLYVMQSPAVGA